MSARWISIGSGMYYDIFCSSWVPELRTRTLLQSLLMLLRRKTSVWSCVALRTVLQTIEYNIDPTTLLSFYTLYQNPESQLRCQGLLSYSFPVQQGTRQGGKSSPLLYLVYIDGLIKELEASGHAFCIFNLSVCSPTVADDMVLVSFSKTGMDNMLEICWQYAKKWRYFYNANTCEVVVFNDRKRAQKSTRFSMGPDIIKESDSYCHLGIQCDKYLSAQTNDREACNKLRGTYHSICTLYRRQDTVTWR